MNSEIIIVGGGVHGCAAAFYLASRGKAVVLLERDSIASGASGGVGDRGVRANGRDLRELPLMRRAYQIWPGINEELGLERGYQRVGGLELIPGDVLEDPRKRMSIIDRVDLQNRYGIATRLVSRSELDELEPGFSDSIAGAVYCEKDGIGDHTEITRGFARAAAAKGAQVLEGRAVTRIEKGGSGYRVLTADGGLFIASENVVVLCNSYARTLLSESFGIDLPLTRFNPQMTPVRVDPVMAFSHLIGHVSLPLAAKTISDGTVMLSGGRTGTWDEEADAGDVDVDVPGLAIADMETAHPGYGSAQTVFTDASRPESVCLDGVPIIDRVPGHGQVLFGAGWSGHGFAIAPAVAEAIRDWLITGGAPDALAPFALRRFFPRE